MSEPLDSIKKAMLSRNYEFRKHYWENIVLEGGKRPFPSAVISSIRNDDPEIIEHYPNDPRGASCLILGTNGNGRRIHTIIAYWCNPMRVVSAYVPDDRWIDYRQRRCMS